MADRIAHCDDPARAIWLVSLLQEFIEAPVDILTELGVAETEPTFIDLQREGLIEAVILPGSSWPSGYRVPVTDRIALSAQDLTPVSAEMHASAARHFDAAGRLGPTIFHLTRLGRHDDALALLRRPLSGHDATVGLDDLRFALQFVPSDVLHADPEALALRLLLSHFPPLEPARSRAALEASLLSLPRRMIDDLPLGPRTVATTAAVGALVARGRSAEASATGRDTATELLALPWSAVHEFSRPAGLLWTAQAEADMLEGRIGTASDYSRAALQSADDGAHLYGKFMIEATASAIASIEGRFEHAAQLVREAELHYSLGNWPASTKLYPVILARLLIAQWQLDSAALHGVAARFRDMPADATHPWWAAADVSESYAHLFSSQPQLALSKIRRVVRFARSRTVPKLLRSLVAAAHADTLNALGRPGLALDALADETDRGEHAVCFGSRRATSKLLAGDPRGAMLATEACVELGRRHVPRTLVAALIRRAIAQDQLGSHRAADATFSEALSQLPASPTPFFGLDPGMLTALWDRAGTDYGELRAAVESMVAARTRHRSPAIARALSSRELDVLRLLRSGATIPEVGDTLYLSTNTVKTHLRTLYRKLGASNRQEAVDVGDSLGL